MALFAWSFDSNKIDRYFFKTFVWKGNILAFIINCGIKALGLIFYQIPINLIYTFFVSSLIAIIGDWIGMFSVMQLTKSYWVGILSCN